MRRDAAEAPRLVGRTPGMVEVLRRIADCAPRDVTVLILGETGTGKEVVARSLHWYSTRADGPFKAISMAGVPATLVESELGERECDRTFDGLNEGLGMISLSQPICRVLAVVGACLSFLPPTPIGAQASDLVPLSSAQRLIPTELARVGGYDNREPYVFGRIGGAVVLSPGRIAVVEQQMREVRVFSSDGVFSARFGGRGDGPGEFQEIEHILTLRDRLVIVDGVARRLSLFSLDTLEPLSTHRTDAVRLVGLTDLDGEMAMIGRQGRNLFGLPPGSYRDTVRFTIHVAEPHQRGPRPLGAAPGSLRVVEDYGTGGGIREPLFERAVVAAVVGDKLVFGNSGEPSLHWIGLDGDTQRGTWELHHRARPVSEQEIEIERQRLLHALEARSAPMAGVGPPGFAERFPDLLARQRRRVETAEAHATFPEFRRIIAGGDGSLWVEDYPAPSADTVRWYRLNEGLADAWFDIETDALVLDVAYGLVVHLVKDDLGVESIIVSRLESVM